ncbi:MAG TPA: hypothetical protein VHK89_00705, partial [Actinomycetota bacterium]|nr:hypothetical protein [Actinomycetota bacterium]
RGERAALNEKLRNALGQLVAMEEIRTARTRARAEADALRREREALSAKLERALAQLAAAEDRARPEGAGVRGGDAGSGDDPLREALGRLVTAESIRTQREGLRAEIDGLRKQNAALQARVRELEERPASRDEPAEVRVARSAGARPPAPVVRLDPKEAEDEAQQEPWWRAFIQQADRY